MTWGATPAICFSAKQMDLACRDRQRYFSDRGDAAKTDRERIDLKESHRPAPWKAVWATVAFPVWRPGRPDLAARTEVCRAGGSRRSTRHIPARREVAQA